LYGLLCAKITAKILETSRETVSWEKVSFTPMNTTILIPSRYSNMSYMSLKQVVDSITKNEKLKAALVYDLRM
jgi:hypothetical protein